MPPKDEKKQTPKKAAPKPKPKKRPAVDVDSLPDLSEYGLAAKQERAIFLLLEYGITDTARIIGVDQSTIHRWFDDPNFDAASRAVRDALHRQTMSSLLALGPKAVDTLAEVMDSSPMSDAPRVTAARTVLEYIQAGKADEETAERIERMERIIENIAPTVKPKVA